jgi:hypothetical protein
VLLPALLLLLLASINLVITYRGQGAVAEKKSERRAGGTGWSLAYYVLALALVLGLTLVVLIGAARIPLAEKQAQADLPVFDALATSARQGDALLVAMPAFGDVQEFSALLMAYLEPALPAYVWIEGEPRAIQPDERERVWAAVRSEAQRVWLFERWFTPADAVTATAAQLNQEAFPIEERWIAESGKLTLYELADSSQPAPPSVPMDVPFQGSLTLVDFTVWNDGLSLEPGDTLRLRLTWRATGNDLSPREVPASGVTAFAQVLDQATPARNIVQSDRLLVDVQNLAQSPLQPGHTIRQGYGLQLPGDLTPGSYPIIVGLYDSATGQRLQRADDSPDDFVYLTDILVK